MLAQSKLLWLCIYRDAIVMLGGWVGGHQSLDSSSQPSLPVAPQAFIGTVLLPALPDRTLA